MISVESRPDYTQCLLKTSKYKHLNKYMTTARPLLPFLNISGIIYGYVPGPLLLDVIVTWAASLSSDLDAPMSQTNTPLRFLVICTMSRGLDRGSQYQKLSCSSCLASYLELTSTFCGFMSWWIWHAVSNKNRAA